MSNSIDPVILRPKKLKPNDRGGGISSIPLVTRKIGSTSFINGITDITPGAAVELHTHNCDESVVVLSGQAIAEIAGVRDSLETHDTSWIPAGVAHRFINASDTTPLRIFWTYASVNATRTLLATGQIRTIDSEHGH